MAEVVGIKLLTSRKVKKSFDKAAAETGMLKRDIAEEALIDWLVSHGFMEEDEDGENEHMGSYGRGDAESAGQGERDDR